MTAGKRRVLLGEITGVHGIKGDVLVRSYTALPEGIADYGPLADETGKRALVLRVRRTTGKGVVAHIDGVDDRTSAEALKGTRLYVDRDRMPEPDTGEFYHADLVGLAAVTPAGDPLGTVVAVVNYGASDLLEIRPPGRKTTDLVPFTTAFVPTVDLAAGRLVVDMPATSEENEGGMEGTV
ncbi:MAG: ribosome maturation factor RimM [Pseudomonadota bacterium]